MDDPQIQLKVMKKMQLTLTNLESSNFYRTLIAQIQTPQLISSFSKVLSSSQPTAQKVQMVIYGIGSMESNESPRQPLSLAILLTRQFDWIGGIEIFDPIISEMESRVMEALGCTVLMINEQGRREVKESMFFFMLKANGRTEQLKRMVVFGNSFERYEHFVSEFKSPVVVNSSRYILQARRFCEEVGIEAVFEDFFGAFDDTSFHFFNLEQHILD